MMWAFATCQLSSKKHLCPVPEVVPCAREGLQGNIPELLLSGFVSLWSFLLWCSAHKTMSKCSAKTTASHAGSTGSFVLPFLLVFTSCFLPGSLGWSWLGHLRPKIKQNNYNRYLLQIPQRLWLSTHSSPPKLWFLKQRWDKYAHLLRSCGNVALITDHGIKSEEAEIIHSYPLNK